MDGNQTGLAAEGLPDLSGSGQRSGVGLGGPGAALGYPSFKDDNRFFRGNLFDLLEESPAVLQPFHIGAYEFRFFVQGQIFEELMVLQVAGVAVTDYLAEMNTLPGGQGDEMPGQLPALGNNAYGTLCFREIAGPGQSSLRAV